MFKLPRQLPSPVFGDGSHPTTILCARAVDFLCRQNHPSHVLDVGTGTGVLARIARAHGASFVVATDIDPVALETAQANAELDESPRELIVTHALPSHWGARFDLVIANILEGVLLSLKEELYQALAPGGLLLLSGFTRVQTPALELAFTSQGLELVSRSQSAEWILLQFRKV
jgi:ribosomal protein L11 methyltransferase